MCQYITKQFLMSCPRNIVEYHHGIRQLLKGCLKPSERRRMWQLFTLRKGKGCRQFCAAQFLDGVRVSQKNHLWILTKNHVNKKHGDQFQSRDLWIFLLETYIYIYIYVSPKFQKFFKKTSLENSKRRPPTSLPCIMTSVFWKTCQGSISSTGEKQPNM